MAKLSDIAKVLIELRTSAIGKASFGIPMIAARLGPAFEKRVYTFNSANEAQDLKGTDGSSKLPGYLIRAVEIAFSQTPRIEKVIVGNLYETTTETAQVNKAIFDAVTGYPPDATDFSISVDGTIYSTRSDTGAQKKLDAVTNELSSQITANAGIVAKYDIVTDAANGVITLTVKKIGDVPLVLDGANVAVAESGAMLGTYPVQLNEIQGNDNSWYGFAVMGVADSDQNDIAQWAESAEPPVQYWGTSDTPAIWNTTAGDVLDQLRNASYHRTIFTPSMHAGDEHPQVAAMARFFVGEPGSIVAGLKTLTGVTFTPFTPDQSKTVLGKNGNTYERYAANVFLFNPGKTVAGDWVDEIRDRDWLSNYIQTTMAGALLRAPKIPYTNPGITTLVNILQGCLRYAQQKGVIAPDQVDALGNTVPGFVIEAPNALDVPFDIKASRVLTLRFTALLAGAIQKVEINGVLTYSYDGA